MNVLEPAGLRRRDGASVYATAHSQLYTTRALLNAERRILAAAEHTDGHRVPAGLIELALLEARLTGRPLNAGQQAMVRELASSGRRVQVAIAPAGSGKTTALGVLAAAWTDNGGTVVGAAPSAVAASELRKATGHPAVTLAAALRAIDTGRNAAGMNDHGPAPRIGGVALGPQLLVLVDEAGMAVTTDLAALIDAVTAADGSVRLVGDTAQLSSPGAGGIVHDLVRAHGGVQLDTPVRFTDPAEARATLAIRAGDPDGLTFYAERGRIHTPANTLGTEQSVPEAAQPADTDRDDVGDVVDSALAGWAADRAAGRDSLLLAGSNAVVTELNARARAARLAGTPATADGADTELPEVQLRDGTAASVGDVVLARHNRSDLHITATEWVKNGDRFTVTALTGDGGLRVRHAPSRRQLTLPADYVAEHLQLGYAATIHLAPGRHRRHHPHRADRHREPRAALRRTVPRPDGQPPAPVPRPGRRRGSRAPRTDSCRQSQCQTRGSAEAAAGSAGPHRPTALGHQRPHRRRGHRPTIARRRGALPRRPRPRRGTQPAPR